MKKNLHPIDDLFNDAVQQHSDKPSPDLWQQLDHQLDQRAAIVWRNKYRNLKMVAAALLLLLTVTGIALWRRQSTAQNLVQSLQPSTPQSKQHPAFDQPHLPADQSTKMLSDDYDSNTNVHLPATTASHNASSSFQTSNQKTLPSNATINNKLLSNESGKATGAANDIANNDPTEALNYYKKIKKVQRIGNLTSTAIAGEQEIVSAENSYINGATDEMQQPKTTQSIPLAEPILLPYRKDWIPQKKLVAAAKSPELTVTNNAIKQKGFHQGGAWSVTPFIGLSFSDNDVRKGRHRRDNDNDRDEDDFKEKEQHHPTSNYGLLVEYQLNKHWSIGSGVTVLNKKTGIESQQLFAEEDEQGNVGFLFNCTSGYSFITSKNNSNPSVGDSILATATVNTIQYIGVPLQVKYRVQKNKFTLFTTAGVGINFLTKGNISTQLQQGNTKENVSTSNIAGLKKTFINGMIGVGIDYRLNNWLALSLSPIYNYSLDAINKSGPVDAYPKSFAIQSGLRLTL